jgi:isochorismate hydrolase
MTHRLVPDRAVLLVVDVQDRLVAAMPADVAERTVKNTAVLVEAAHRFGIPIVASEQYPKGLGKTVAAVAAALAAAGPLVRRVEKLEFSLAGKLSGLGLPASPQWILAGMETHVCVYQTARDLIESGEVHVVADAVCSRTAANWQIGLDRMRADAATITSTEMVVFDLLGKAGTDDFKALSRLIK